VTHDDETSGVDPEAHQGNLDGSGPAIPQPEVICGGADPVGVSLKGQSDLWQAFQNRRFLGEGVPIIGSQIPLVKAKSDWFRKGGGAFLQEPRSAQRSTEGRTGHQGQGKQENNGRSHFMEIGC